MAYAHTAHCSKQQAAREMRYGFFERIRKETSANVVATAHQANDNAETVLLNVMRGTGVRGLAGIPVYRQTGNVIRPLLFAYRSEIEQYASAQNISYRNDSSNTSLMYKRNFLRHRIIPELQAEFDPHILVSLNKMASVMRGFNEALSSEVHRRLHCTS